MSSTPEQENFEKVRQLLAVKRHEQPPPGYFHDFSRQVIARIQSGELAANNSLLGRLFRPFRSAWAGFEAKPIVAGVFGVGVCGLLIFGLVSSERNDSALGTLAPGSDTVQPFLAKVPRPTVATSLSPEGLFERASAETGGVYTAQSRSSIFSEIQRPVNPYAQPVKFSTSTSN